ncbi:MAG TPA: Mu transposase C-terminal domain-containing protein [Candidatus Adamsella sp.]|nr:Mu transposase C-terminal domain-containing protein [Candidatus Adamsella sp.]
MENQVETIKYTPEKAKQNALAKLDLIRKWQEFRRKAVNKLQADYDFVKLHNSSNSYLFSILGKISRGSLHRWKASLDGTEDYTRLIPNYKYVSVNEYRTCLTDEEIKIFMGLLLHPNRICIGKAIALTKYKLKEQGQSFIPADITFRRYAKWFKDNNYDKWVLARDGEKALSDKVEPYIKRDASLLDVGDILVADGHKLAFQVINPFTGKPCRATLVGFLDWKSTALVGYEIMLEENTQCIASALRNSIISLDMIPKIVYQDNGRAFRAKYFTDDKGFGELGFYGLYAKLGIETVFARPYNARSKVIERFFKEFQEGFEKLMPSYVGSSIINKPAYLKRNEKFHSNLHNALLVGGVKRARSGADSSPLPPIRYIPTIEETIKMIDMWLKFKNSRPCTNAPNMTIAEVLENRKKQNIDKSLLDDLMLATEVKTIQRNGVRFLNCDYFDERLYGLRGRVLVKYNLFDLTNVKIFTPKGEYLCTAERVTETHPMAKILGTVEDLEDYKQKIQKQQKLKRKTINSVKKLLTNDEIKLIEARSNQEEMENSNNFQKEFKARSNGVHKINNGEKSLPIFKNNSEKYEYLIKHNPSDTWIAEFKQTKEYKLLYE